MPGRAVHAVIPALGRLTLGDSGFQASLGYSETLFQKQALNDSSNNKQQLKADSLEAKLGSLGKLNSTLAVFPLIFPPVLTRFHLLNGLAM